MGACHGRGVRPAANRTKTLDDVYTVGDIIGRGAFGTVNEGRHRVTGRPVAIKRLNKAQSHPEFLINELAVLTQIGSHDHIVEFVEYFDDGTTLTLVFEYMKGGELFDRLVHHGPYSEKDAHGALVKVAHALHHLHKKRIIHRDLKPENLLLSSPDDPASVKLADFGLSKILRPNQQLTRVCGTWAYGAPEMATKQGYDLRYDMWSFGVIMYIVLSGFHPFDPEGDYPAARVKALSRQGLYSLQDPVWNRISASAKSLIQQLLVVDPKSRLSADELVAHPWMQKTVPEMSAEPIKPDIDAALQKYRQSIRRKLKLSLNASFAICSMRRMSSERKKRDDNGASESKRNIKAESVLTLSDSQSSLSAMSLASLKQGKEASISSNANAAAAAAAAAHPKALPSILTSLRSIGGSSKLVTIKSGKSYADDDPKKARSPAAKAPPLRAAVAGPHGAGSGVGAGVGVGVGVGVDGGASVFLGASQVVPADTGSSSSIIAAAEAALQDAPFERPTHQQGQLSTRTVTGVALDVHDHAQGRRVSGS